MADLRIGMHQDRHQVAKTLRQDRIIVDIDDIDDEREFAAQCRERREHLIAQMAIAASVENQP